MKQRIKRNYSVTASRQKIRKLEWVTSLRKIKKRQSTMFRRYFKSAALIIFCAFLFYGFTMMVFVSGQWWNEKVETLTRNARNISDSYVDILQDDNVKGKSYIKSTLDIMCQATVSDYFISDLSGNIILCADGEELVCERHGGLVVSEEHMKQAVDGGFSDYATVDEFGEGRFLVAVPVKNGNETVAVVFAVEDAITGLLPYVSSIMTSAVTIMFVAMLISMWIRFFFTVSCAYLAITLSTTILANKKGKGVLSVVFFFVITFIVSRITAILPKLETGTTMGAEILNNIWIYAFQILMIIGSYLFVSFMLKKKISL